MELDDLKTTWKQAHGEAPGKSGQQLHDMLQRRPGLLVNRLRRSLRLELAITVLFGAGCLWVALEDPGTPVSGYLMVFGVVLVLFLGVLLALYRKTGRLLARPAPVRQNLEAFLQVLKTFVARYYQFSMAMIPACIVLSLALSYRQHPAYFSSAVFWREKSWVLALVMLALGTAVYYFNKWYLHRLYGRYLHELEQSLAELREPSNEDAGDGHTA